MAMNSAYVNWSPLPGQILTMGIFPSPSATVAPITTMTPTPPAISNNARNDPESYKTIANEVWNQLLINGTANKQKKPSVEIQAPVETLPAPYHRLVPCYPPEYSMASAATGAPVNALQGQPEQGFLLQQQECEGLPIYGGPSTPHYEYITQFETEVLQPAGVYYPRDHCLQNREVPADNIMVYHPITCLRCSDQQLMTTNMNGGNVPQYFPGEQLLYENSSENVEIVDEEPMPKFQHHSAAVLLKERVLDLMKNELPTTGPIKRLPKPPTQTVVPSAPCVGVVPGNLLLVDVDDCINSHAFQEPNAGMATPTFGFKSGESLEFGQEKIRSLNGEVAHQSPKNGSGLSKSALIQKKNKFGPRIFLRQSNLKHLVYGRLVKKT